MFLIMKALTLIFNVLSETDKTEGRKVTSEVKYFVETVWNYRNYFREAISYSGELNFILYFARCKQM